MAFDKKTRGLLQRTVAACRRVLDREFTAQLQELYGIQPNGSLTPLAALAHLGDEELEVARLLRERLNHLEGGSASGAPTRAKPEHVARVIREQAFTVLNRLAALRLCEERELVQECVRQGVTSEGFLLFRSSAGAALGDTHTAYLAYLNCLFDELALDLGVLFDRFSPLALLFPRQDALTEVLKELNGSGKATEHQDIALEHFAEVWRADETIGWIYQYYNDDAERKKMREESAAPRNSREMAVRNQFFTPRYVVEFLTDNTLGRIWYEMTLGDTSLKEQCRYLVRRSTDIFLGPGDTHPERPTQDTLSQDDLLKRPVHIPHRPLKDPRTILVLDPACGSMHFGLYAFDLFEVIYDEAWALEATLGADALSRPLGMQSLHTTYAGKDAFLKDVPRLIIEHNLHGIDIDPRCAQIAGLSLWLRAQKKWQLLGLTPAERPTISRSNLVCAEPMPGEKELLREFVDRAFPSEERGVFLRLLEGIFDQMQLAGEAGSLLKIEEEIRGAIAAAKRLWQAEPLLEQAKLFPELATARQATLAFDFGGITDEQFWDSAESRIYAALRDYAEQADSGGGFQRRLFAEDAARGFAFIDICKRRYDVALMNPPFGDASLPSKPYIEDTYGDTKGDVYKAFVECFHARLVPAGYLGIISSRTGFFLGQSEDWRTRVVFRLFRPIALADLGSGVLDAMVEVAAYVLRNLSAPEARDLTNSIVPVLGKVVRDSQDRFSLPRWQAARGGLKRHQAVAELEHLEAHGFVQRSSGDTVRYTPLWNSVKAITAPPEPVFPPLVCVRALRDSDKDAVLLEALTNDLSSNRFVSDTGNFAALPGAPFSYWVSNRVRSLFDTLPQFATEGREAWMGLSSGFDPQWLRLVWEIPAERQGRNREASRLKGWVPLSKGGEFATFYPQIHIVVDWTADGARLSAWKSSELAMERISANNSKCWNQSKYFRKGVTWSRRSQKGLSVRILPAGTIFGDKGPGAFAAGDDETEIAAFAALFNSTVYRGLVALQMAFGSYEVGVIQRTVVPRWTDEARDELGAFAIRAWLTKRSLDSVSSTSLAFLRPALLADAKGGLAVRAATWAARVRTSEETVAALQADIDDLAFRLYGLDDADRAALTSTLATEANGEAEAEAGEDEEGVAASTNAPELAPDLLDYCLGVAFGRWDIRYATGEQAAPELPDPFAPLPVCPPAQLQNAQGLPARPEDMPAAYPIRIPWDGILVDDPNHPLDLERRVREVIEIIWSGQEGSPTAEAIELEACEILGVKSLRDYFRKPAGFFADHLKCYSKSRRQAPIYWPLSTASGSYTLWIYYHRLTDQTLYKCIQQFIDPKLADVERELAHLRSVLDSGEGSTKNRRQLDDAEQLRTELKEMRAELEHWASRWKPNLNDGVLISASPLWKLFRLPKWRKDLETCWNELAAANYEWAHLAYTLWPDRVRNRCKTDRSLAIAHGLEALCEVQLPAKKAKAARKRGATPKAPRLM
jgi:hypothetical protein